MVSGTCSHVGYLEEVNAISSGSPRPQRPGVREPNKTHSDAGGIAAPIGHLSYVAIRPYWLSPRRMSRFDPEPSGMVGMSRFDTI